MKGKIYVCLPNLSNIGGDKNRAGAGYLSGRILQSRHEGEPYGPETIVWPSDGDTNIGVFFRALRSATPQEEIVYYRGVRNIKDIKEILYEIF